MRTEPTDEALGPNHCASTFARVSWNHTEGLALFNSIPQTFGGHVYSGNKELIEAVLTF